MTKLFWNRPWPLSITAGVLLGLSFPPFDIAVAQIPAFIFLLRTTELSHSSRQVVYYLYPSFILWNIITTYWLTFATVAGGIAAILANSLLMVIPFLFIRKLLLKEIKPYFSGLLIACLWVAYEFLHHNWDLAWTWLALGNGWSNFPGIIQFISITGYLGISFWITFSSALFYHSIQKFSTPVFFQGIIVFLIFPFFSIISLLFYSDDEQAEPVEVAVIQPNLDSYENLGGYNSFTELLTAHLEISDSVRTENTSVIIWPENALETALTLQSSAGDRIKDSLAIWNTSLITGSGYVKYYMENEAPPLTRGVGRSGPYNVYNAAFHFKPGKPNNVYEKGRLVPIVEGFPFVNFFHSIDKTGWIDWSSLMGYDKGSEATLFDINGFKTPALICYDSVFPGWVRQFVNNGADFITIITNDGWWGNTSGHIQHFAYARLRAIEFRRWIVRSANNGISGIIAPDGSVHVETDYWVRTGFTFNIYPSDKKTFYALYGDWFNWLMVAGAFAGIFISFFNKSTNGYWKTP
ncbi:MAG: apolipoprotein N-acyltransferase [Balneolaceae bacterium]